MKLGQNVYLNDILQDIDNGSCCIKNLGQMVMSSLNLGHMKLDHKMFI